HSHMPSAAVGAGVVHQPGCGFGKAVGHPIGSASVAGSKSTLTSMCSNPSSRARSDAGAPRAGQKTTSTARRGYLPNAAPPALRGGALVLHARRHDHADGLEVLAEHLVEVLGDELGRPAAVAPHPRDLLRVLEQRERVVGTAEDLAVDVPGA